MSDVINKSLRADPEKVQAFLDRLDARSAAAEGGRVARNERFSYRVRALIVEFADQMRVARHNAPPRNISREGIAFLLGNFVYPGTTCRIRLVSEYNHVQVVNATVIPCQYLPGSASIYEVGVKFERPIDVAMFHRAANRIRVLLADDDATQQRLVAHFLKAMSVDVTTADSGRSAVQLATSGPFELVLMDMEMPELGGLEAVKELRQQGYARPIVAVTDHTSDAIRQECLEAGFTDFVGKPLTREVLAKLVEAAKVEPLVSSFVQNPDMADLIDQFVAELPATVTALEAAFGQDDRAALERTTRALKGQAGSFGFEVITSAAASLEQAVGQEAEKSDLRGKLTQLVRLCLAARPAGCADA